MTDPTAGRVTVWDAPDPAFADALRAHGFETSPPILDDEPELPVARSVTDLLGEATRTRLDAEDAGGGLAVGGLVGVGDPGGQGGDPGDHGADQRGEASAADAVQAAGAEIGRGAGATGPADGPTWWVDPAPAAAPTTLAELHAAGIARPGPGRPIAAPTAPVAAVGPTPPASLAGRIARTAPRPEPTADASAGLADLAAFAAVAPVPGSMEHAPPPVVEPAVEPMLERGAPETPAVAWAAPVPGPFVADPEPAVEWVAPDPEPAATTESVVWSQPEPAVEWAAPGPDPVVAHPEPSAWPEPAIEWAAPETPADPAPAIGWATPDPGPSVAHPEPSAWPEPVPWAAPETTADPAPAIGWVAPDPEPVATTESVVWPQPEPAVEWAAPGPGPVVAHPEPSAWPEPVPWAAPSATTSPSVAPTMVDEAGHVEYVGYIDPPAPAAAPTQGLEPPRGTIRDIGRRPPGTRPLAPSQRTGAASMTAAIAMSDADRLPTPDPATAAGLAPVATGADLWDLVTAPATPEQQPATTAPMSRLTTVLLTLLVVAVIVALVLGFLWSFTNLLGT